MQVTINDIPFDEQPASCGACGFFSNGTTDRQPGSPMGLCRLYEEMHHRWCQTPRRCARLFRKAAQHPDGTKLYIVTDEEII
jgi:hypothetical protein